MRPNANFMPGEVIMMTDKEAEPSASRIGRRGNGVGTYTVCPVCAAPLPLVPMADDFLVHKTHIEVFFASDPRPSPAQYAGAAPGKGRCVGETDRPPGLTEPELVLLQKNANL